MSHICSDSELEQMRLWSMSAMTLLSRRLWRTALLIAWNVEGAVQRPNGITRYLYNRYLVRRAVIHSSPFLIHRRWNPFLKSRLVNWFALPDQSLGSYIQGNG